MSTTLKTAGEQTMLYRYDQLNRIKTAVSAQNTYQIGYSYDANGNILSLLRNDHNNQTIDNLSYSYNTNVNNRLNQIRDDSGDNTGLNSSPTPFSYQYDNIGNLIEDEEKEIGEITWTVYGKVESVEKNDGTMISYKYDATGNRIYKKVNTTETHYVRDASGNLMATYQNQIAKDFVIYGSSRLGIYNGNTSEGKRTLGNKKYELSNHLGNVLSVISDNKMGIGTNGVADYYEPLVISESDYYPFGMAMKERSFSNEEYRFGFNTQEKSTEIGEDTYTAEFWQYDSKIARRWNNDPKPNISISVYAAFAGNPLMYNDVKGDTVTGDLISYNSIKSHVQNEILSLDNQINNLQNRINNRIAANRNVANQTNRLNSLTANRQEYQDILNEYTELENSTQTYNIITNTANVPIGAGGVIEYNSVTGNVDVKSGTSLPLFEALPHELKHAYQFETRRLSLGYNGGGGALYDLQDEVEAYSRSKLFGFYAGKTINSAFVRSRGYRTLDINQNTENTLSANFNGAPTKGQQIKRAIYEAGKRNTNPKEVIKDWQLWYNQGLNGQAFTP